MNDFFDTEDRETNRPGFSDGEEDIVETDGAIHAQQEIDEEETGTAAGSSEDSTVHAGDTDPVDDSADPYQAENDSSTGSQGSGYGSGYRGESGFTGNSYGSGSQESSYSSVNQGNSYDSGSRESSYGSVNPGSSYDSGSQESSYGSTNQGNPYRSQSPAGSGSYRFQSEAGANPEGKKPEKKRRKREKKPAKPMTLGRKWAMTIAMAVVFGLIAGGVFCTVTAVGSRSTETAGIAQTENAGSGDTNENMAADGSGKEESSADQEVSGSQSEGEIQQVPEVDAEKAESGGTVANVASNAMPSLVTISTLTTEEIQSFFGESQDYEMEGAGTGVIIGQNDTEILIATNNHVITDADSITVGFIDGTTADAALKGGDSDNDLAIVAVKLDDIEEDTKSQIRVITIGDSDQLVLGDQVVAIGNALGYGQSVTAGYVSAFDRDLTLQDSSGNTFESTGLIQTDAAINGGNSGGALLNMKGELIGINEAKAGSSGSGSASVENMGYAIPINKAIPILDELMTLETREKVSEDNAGYLGVTIADVNSQTAQMYNMPEGACIYEIVENGPSEAAGLKKGDVIVSFDGKTVDSYDSLKDIMAYYSAGETVEVTVKRADDGEYVEHTYSVTLANASDLDYTEAQDAEADSSGDTEDSDDYSGGGFQWILP